MQHRHALPDALRALAMLSVLVMNAIGYAAAPWGPQLGPRSPEDSVWAAVAQGLTGALLQGKGYAILSFVFGMSLWLAARGRARPEALQRGIARSRRLLGLGVLHGVFIYFGDILTLYALVGRRLLRRLPMRWPAFRRHLLWSLGWALASKGVLAVILFMPARASDYASRETLGTVEGVLAFLQMNGSTYLIGQLMALVVAAPAIYLCMLAGVAAARLRLLTHRRWRDALRRYLRVGGAVLLVPVLVHGWLCATGDPLAGVHPGADVLGDLIAIPLAALYLAALGLASAGGQAGWCRRLAPLGRRTLTLYVMHSALCVALLSGVGLALAPGTAQLVLACLALWCVAWAAALMSGSRRWPLEAWMARRT